MNSPVIFKDLVLIGGGHGHVHTIKMFGMKPMEGVRLTLITRDVETPYSGMLPGYVAGYYTRDESHIDLGRLCSFASVRLLHVEACGLDTGRKLVYCKDGRPPIYYDVVSIDIGITPKPHPAKTCITAVKPIDGFAIRWEAILKRCMKITSEEKLSIVIVGGGGGGVELSFAVRHRLTLELQKINRNKDQISVSIVQRGDTLMPSHNPTVRGTVNRLLSEKGIIVHYTEVVDVETTIEGANYLIGNTGSRIGFDEAIWCTDASTQPWLHSCEGLSLTPEGFINVGPTLESISSSNVFACGDVAHLTASPRPKAGVFAVRAGLPLTANLRARLLGQPLEPWEPQETFLGIIGTGDSAIASKGNMCMHGEFLWRLKDRIDRTWMAGYSSNLPDKAEMMASMAANVNTTTTEASAPTIASSIGDSAMALLTKVQMRCGGCGSKVGAGVLERALAQVKALNATRSEVITSSGDDAALLLPPPPGRYLVQTMDYFRNFLSDPYIFGKVAANHALSDLHAMAAEPVSAMALCVLPFGPEAQVEHELVQVLAGMLSVLKEEGCALVGGHTSEGAELAVGLSAYGTVSPERVFHKGPLQPGCALILTKALGTGAIMAADMRAKASGRAVQQCIASMSQSNSTAAKVFGRFGSVACTDVTGFGLLGHLLEMIKYRRDAGNDPDGAKQGSHFAAVLRLSALPLLTGVIECIAEGIMSSLHPENVRCARALSDPSLGERPLLRAPYMMMFDPQTSGGLLACVPLAHAELCIEALRQEGYSAATIIGRVVEKDTTDEFAPLVYLEE